MKRTFKYALSAVIAAAIVVPTAARAQENFPDVDDNHWAYEALLRMKNEGLLVGYPDGFFRGGRPASRYEMAVAIHATYQRLKNITDGLERQIEALKNAGGNTGSGVSKADLDALKQQLEALKNDVNALRSRDIADLRRLTEEFQKELANMGVDIETMKKSLSDLEARVTALEKRKLPVDINGDVNLVLMAGYSDTNYGVTVDGRPTGYGRGSMSGNFVGADKDLTILHEAAIKLTSTNETGPKFRTTLVYGNMFGEDPGPSDPSVFGDQSSTLAGAPFQEGTSDWYAQEFAIQFDTSLAGLGFSADVGRVGYKISPYIFQRPDNTPYYANERWDNGKWTFDGGILGFNFGAAKLDVFGGRNSSVVSSNGRAINPMIAGTTSDPFAFGRPVGLTSDGLASGGTYSRNTIAVDRSLGANLGIPLGENGKINLAYLWLDSDTVSGGANRVTVFGGDADFKFGNLMLSAGYSQSNTGYNDSNIVDDNNTAWYAKLGFGGNRWGLNVGYREIEPLFAAPGDWGRMGLWWNPTNIEGFMGDVHFDLNDQLRLKVSGQFYENNVNTGSVWDGGEVMHLTAGLEYKWGGNYNLLLGYERVDWDLAGAGGDPLEQWYNIGFGLGLSENSSFSILWQISDYDAAGRPDFSWRGFDTAKGGLITTQLSFRY